MIILPLSAYVKTSVLYEELAAAFPNWVNPNPLPGEDRYAFAVVSSNDEQGIFYQQLEVPDSADLQAVQAVLDAHDPEGLSTEERLEAALTTANIGFKKIPTWSTIDPEDGHDHIINSVWNGQSDAQVSAWIDANVTNLAQARTALKQVAGAVISLRDMEARLAQAILYLRDLTIK